MDISDSILRRVGHLLRTTNLVLDRESLLDFDVHAVTQARDDLRTLVGFLLTRTFVESL